jgi:hypothetical protein
LVFPAVRITCDIRLRVSVVETHRSLLTGTGAHEARMSGQSCAPYPPAPEAGSPRTAAAYGYVTERHRQQPLEWCISAQIRWGRQPDLRRFLAE